VKKKEMAPSKSKTLWYDCLFVVRIFYGAISSLQ